MTIKVWVSVVLWFAGGVVLFVVPAFCTWLYYHNYLGEYRGFPLLVFDGNSLISGVSLIALYVTTIAYLEARKQTKSAQEQIKLLTETRPLENTEAIMTEFNAVCSSGIEEIEEAYIAADTIAIGATGDAKAFQKYEQHVLNMTTQLNTKLHAAYTKIAISEIQDDKGITHRVLDAKSVDTLKDFYSRKNITDERIMNEVLDQTEFLHKALLRSSCDYKAISDPQKIVPHFILINPEKTSRRAIIWNIDTVKSGAKGEVVATGFSTTNQQVVKSMLEIFKGLNESNA